MRVIGGEFRSRRLISVPGLDTRPTPDRLRETLFNILSPRIEGATFLDAYAGSGAVGIEALSRGATSATFIERSRGAVDIIRRNLKALGLETRAEVITGKVLTALPRFTPDIAFLDPPYELEDEYSEALGVLGGAAPSLVIVQHSTRMKLRPDYGTLHVSRTVRQGDNVLTFLQPE
ncbi:MAG TPA: 16S rRNA (guanine(966)-N(2))-methyltransferase RsmD [Bryobacteraceae bacterium]|nr:16S rRNA (guanine(966)-N(2))-methyltransferase RsmD [Bryobacteraceae bacterium]